MNQDNRLPCAHDYANSYEFRDPDYTPNDQEKVLIEDAINGYLGLMEEAGLIGYRDGKTTTAPSAPPVMAGAAQVRIETVEMVSSEPLSSEPAPPCYRVVIGPQERCFDFDTEQEAANLRRAIEEALAVPAAWPPVMAGAVTDEMVATGLAVLRNRTWNAIPQDKRIVTEILTAALSVAPGRADGSQAAQDVLAERLRQISSKNWTAEHDDHHVGGQIALAAAAYAVHSSRFADAARNGTNYATVASHPLWPWEREWWKPKSPRADLVRAGALIIAEIERLDRAAPPALTGEK